MTDGEGAKPSARALEVAAYLAITFGITWGIAGAYLAAPRWFEAHFGAISISSPMFYLAVWAPTIAAIAVTAARSGVAGLTELFGRVVRRPFPAWTLVAAITFYPVLMALAHLVAMALGQPFPSPAVWLAMAAQVVSLPALLLGPLGEELGWRGFLLPRILQGRRALIAGLVVGAIWMVWHIPAFLLSGLPQTRLSFPLFVLGGMALSVVVTWLFVNARQNVVVAGVIPHLFANAFSVAAGGMSWTDGLALAALALVLVAAFGLDLQRPPGMAVLKGARRPRPAP